MKVGACIDHGYKGDGLGYARIIHYVDGVRIREGRHVKEIQNRYVKGSRVSGSTALAKEFNITHTQVLYIVKGLSRVQGSGLRENTSWV